MHVNFVGTKRCGALADFGEVQRRLLVREAANSENLAFCLAGAANKDVAGEPKRRAIKQAVDGVDITLARSAGPKVKARRRIGRGENRFACTARRNISGAARTEFRQSDNLGTHNATPLNRPWAVRTSFYAFVIPR